MQTGRKERRLNYMYLTRTHTSLSALFNPGAPTIIDVKRWRTIEPYIAHRNARVGTN